MASSSMKNLACDDITPEKLSWLVEYIDEMFQDQDENENDTY